jgi:hypothetical protein
VRRGGRPDPLAQRHVVLERRERARRGDRVARPISNDAEQVLGRPLVTQERQREVADAVTLRW